MFENHDPYTIKGFRGLHLRGAAENCPPDRLLEAYNVVFRNGSVRTRCNTNGVRVSSPTDTPFPLQYFENADVAYTNWGMLSSRANGTLYRLDSTTPLINVAGWNGKFKLIKLTDDYVIILIDKTTSNLYIWNTGYTTGTPWTTAREAGALAPTAAGAVVAANGGAIGNAPAAGYYVFAVMYETETGHYSKLGPYIAGVKTLTVFQASGAHAIALTVIPTGPAGTVARHILVSRVSQTWDGNFDAHELFFLPGTTGKIADNATTTKTFNSLYAQDLVKSADYLNDRLERIPYAKGMVMYNDRLVMFGGTANPNNILVSDVKDYEGFDSISGSIATPIKTEFGVNCLGELRGNLCVFKNAVTVVYSDDSDYPAEWSKVIVDKSRNTTHVAIVGSDDATSYDDKLIVIADNQVTIFNGVYGEDLTANVPDAISSAEPAFQILIFPPDNYLLVKQGNSTVLFGDFTNGLDASLMKWSKLDYTVSRNAVTLQLVKILPGPEWVYTGIIANGAPVGTANDFAADLRGTSEFNHPVTEIPYQSYVRLPYVGKPNIVSGFIGASLRIHPPRLFTSTLSMTVYGRDDIKILNPRNITIGFGVKYDRYFNLVNEMCSIKLYSTGNYGFELEDINIYGQDLWITRPSV